MTAVNLDPNSNRTAFKSGPAVPESDEVRRSAVADAQSSAEHAFRFYKIARLITAHAAPVMVIERGKPVERRLTANSKLLAWVLASHTNSETGQCNPSTKTLADEIGLQRRALTDAIHLLKEAGFLEVEHGRSNKLSYRLIAPSVGAVSDPDERDDAHPDERDGALLDERDGAHRMRTTKLNYEEELQQHASVRATEALAASVASPKPRAAAPLRASTAGEAEALKLADYVEETTGQRPSFTPRDFLAIEEFIAEHGREEWVARALYAIGEEKFWRAVITDRLARFIGGLPDIAEQMAENLEKDRRRDAADAAEKQRTMFVPRRYDFDEPEAVAA